ncbi:hypothetical protein DMENIID0001_064050 [Sergentomyia squamirostris]
MMEVRETNLRSILIILCFIVTVINCDEVNRDSGRKLLRRKRYLTFPEGSSLQVIYDQTIPVVALPLVFTVGVTVAIAYELPSKPLSELVDDFRNKFELPKSEGNNSKSDNINKITYIANRHNLYYNDDPKVKANVQYQIKRKDYYPPQSQQIYYVNNKPNPWIDNDKFNYYFGGNSVNYGNEDKKFSYIKMLANQYAKSAKSAPYREQKKKKEPNINRSFQKKLPYHRQRIYPVFGKRSINEEIDQEEEENNKMYHVTTRQRLYGSIEKYLEKKGMSGRECVLKSLCETQNNEQELPNTFMGAILKSIFRLPKLDYPGDDDINEYMRAHHEVNDCSRVFSVCKSSFWTSEFVK